MTVKVAICIPYYNSFKCLIRLIDSILEQTYFDYCVVISVDYWSQEEEVYFNKLGQRFHVYYNSTRIGATKNNNQSIKQAQKFNPEYIKIMHQDDYFSDEDSLGKFVNFMENNPLCDLAFSNFCHDNGKEIVKSNMNKDNLIYLQEDYRNILGDNLIGAPSVTIVRNKNIYMDEYLTWTVDCDWYAKFLCKNNKFIYIDEYLINIGIEKGRLTDDCLKNQEMILREYLYLAVKYENYKNTSLDMRNTHNFMIHMFNQTSYWNKEFYQGILNDAIKDNYEFIAIGNTVNDILRVIDIMTVYNISINNYILNSYENEVDILEKYKRIDVNQLDDKKQFAIINQPKARMLRMDLSKKNIRSLPYIEKYIVG